MSELLNGTNVRAEVAEGLLKRPVGKRQSGRRTRAGALERRGWQEGRRYRSWRTSRSIRRPEAARSNARIQFPRSFNHFECASSLEPLVSSPVVLFLSLSLYIYIEREREKEIYIYIYLFHESHSLISRRSTLSRFVVLANGPPFFQPVHTTSRT